MTAGKQGCPCINSTDTLYSLMDERNCRLNSTGEPGVILTVMGVCVPYSYGSSRCLQHDLRRDPACQPENIVDDITPPYCFRPWCFVDADTCMRESNERVYRSSYFSYPLDLFYSYSTCNSTADDWFAVQSDKVSHPDLGQISIKANVPTYFPPMTFKRDPTTKEILRVTGDEYYDNNIPYEGVYIDYAESIIGVSKGDVRNITYTHRSRVSSDLHPSGPFTAACQDIQDGLVDMSVGPYWITRERLRMTSFTVPIVLDKTLLVIPKPRPKESVGQQISKVLAPFTDGVWGIVAAIIIVTGFLSVWFADRSKMSSGQMRSLRQAKKPLRRRKRAYLRLVIDSVLEKGTFFCSAGIEQERGASLPNKLLMFGFGSFILISVSSYVANLAAFLTRSSLEGSVTSIHSAIAKEWKICASPTIRQELEAAWPQAKTLFVYPEPILGFHSQLDAYDAKKCNALAIGWEDTSMDGAFIKRLCKMELVYSESILVEIPIAFPIRPELTAGFSYWMLEAEKNHKKTLQTAKDEYMKRSGETDFSSCDVHFSGEYETSDYDPITIGHMALPIIIYLSFCFLAVIGQLVQLYYKKKGRSEGLSFIGRNSQLCLTTDEPSHIPRVLPRQRTAGSNSNPKKDDDSYMAQSIHNLPEDDGNGEDVQRGLTHSTLESKLSP